MAIASKQKALVLLARKTKAFFVFSNGYNTGGTTKALPIKATLPTNATAENNPDSVGRAGCTTFSTP